MFAIYLVIFFVVIFNQESHGFGLKLKSFRINNRQSNFGVHGTTAIDRDHVSVSTGARSMTMMPIGVPKVAYKMPGSRGGEWVDIYQRLTRERIIFMGSEIDDEMANQIIGVLLVRLF